MSGIPRTSATRTISEAAGQAIGSAACMPMKCIPPVRTLHIQECRTLHRSHESHFVPAGAPMHHALLTEL